MKKLFLLSFLLIFSLVANAQREVTKFLGIPVDGTKTEMIQKLKAKGFTSTSFDKEILEGEFNGKQVNVNVVTNNRKVCRIGLFYANPVNETDIKTNFNNLYRQFLNNPKYVQASFDESIPDSEDISYEMTVHNKRYERAFYQISETDGLVDENRLVWFMISESYGKYAIIMFYDNGYNQANGEDL